MKRVKALGAIGKTEPNSLNRLSPCNSNLLERSESLLTVANLQDLWRDLWKPPPKSSGWAGYAQRA